MRDWVSWVKAVSFCLLAFISFALNMNMFIQLSLILFWDKILLGLTSLAFEGGKIFNLIQAGGFWDKSKDKKKYNKKERFNFRAKSIRKFWMYGMLAAIAIVASFGFTLVTVNHRDKVLTVSDNYTKISELKTNITDNKNKIKSLEDDKKTIDNQLSKLNPTYIESNTDSNVKDENSNTNKSTFKSKKLDPLYVQLQTDLTNKKNNIEFKISEKETENKSYQKQIDDLQKAENLKDKSEEVDDMFSLIGQTFNIDKKIVMFVILLAISLALEILLFSLSFDNDLLHKKEQKDIKKNKNENKNDIDNADVDNISDNNNSNDSNNMIINSVNSNLTEEEFKNNIILLKQEFDDFHIKESVFRFIYNQIYVYIKEKLRTLKKEDTEYHTIDFCITDIPFEMDIKIVRDYCNYLHYKGLIVRSDIHHNIEYPTDKVYYKLKFFIDYDSLMKKRIR